MMAQIFDMTKAELESFLQDRGLKKFRASQIFHYIYNQGITQWEDMVLLPKSDRALLEKELPIYFPEILSQLESKDGKTVKLLLKLADGQSVETVLMSHDYGNSICISSQVGCAVNCAFCASAKNGFVRDLTAGEMMLQLLAFKKYITPELHSIVIMGTGEPLLNFDQVVRFLQMVHAKDTFYMGYRNITLSTSGIVPRMYELASLGFPITLAVSLHAPTDEIRRTIMPIADTYSINDIVAAADHYFETTGRKVTYEYILIKNKNCSESCAKQLTELLHGKNILINLIPINDNYDVGLHRPSSAEINTFTSYLQKHGLNVTLRKEMGSNIQAACGQLRIKREKN
jgi:23S rRNA (adenine2503-C2)-methyltransferase